jgi:histidinol dehydrogenase/sulfopropanediol 3-dehydrogenase
MRYLKEPTAEPFSGYAVPDEVQETVTEVLDRVESDGDEAVLGFTAEFDDVSRERNALSDEEISEAVERVSPDERRIIDNSIENIRTFAQAQRDHVEEFEVEMQPGITLGQKVEPVENVGAYVPGGGYPLLSSALMATVPADVAGVEQIQVASPPKAGGIPHPAIVYGAVQGGADEIYAVGGAQAVAGMALGTEEIASVDMIVGPGNIFVTEAKRQVFGEVGIDLLAGPSEILVLADETADPEIVAADLLAQAEHDVNARPLLVTPSGQLGEDVASAVEAQLEGLSTASVAGQSWEEMGAVIVTEDLTEAIEVSHELAPEHLEVQTESPRQILDDLTNYGTLFLGEHSANVFSDKLVGTNHVLPTQQSARYTAGLSVHKFLKHPTYQEVDEAGAASLEPWATRQSEIEKLEGHVKSSFVRGPDNELSAYDETDHQLPDE